MLSADRRRRDEARWLVIHSRAVAAIPNPASVYALVQQLHPGVGRLHAQLVAGVAEHGGTRLDGHACAIHWYMFWWANGLSRRVRQRTGDGFGEADRVRLMLETPMTLSEIVVRLLTSVDAVVGQVALVAGHSLGREPAAVRWVHEPAHGRQEQQDAEFSSSDDARIRKISGVVVSLRFVDDASPPRLMAWSPTRCAPSRTPCGRCSARYP